jgi:hypothetical protein
MQHTSLTKPNGNKPIAIEVDGEPLGVVVSAPEGFRFLAVRFNAFGIDGQVFPSVEAAQVAASNALIQSFEE